MQNSLRMQGNKKLAISQQRISEGNFRGTEGALRVNLDELSDNSGALSRQNNDKRSGFTYRFLIELFPPTQEHMPYPWNHISYTQKQIPESTTIKRKRLTEGCAI